MFTFMSSSQLQLTRRTAQWCPRSPHGSDRVQALKLCPQRKVGSSALAGCRKKGPQIQHTKTPGDEHIILHPDETFGGWPEAGIGPWEQMQQVLHDLHVWRGHTHV